VAIAAVATTVSASWLWTKKATPGPTGSGGMRQQTQTTGRFAQRVRGATFHIAALQAQIYQDMSLCWEQLRVIQLSVILFFPRIEEKGREAALEDIHKKMAALVDLAQKIAAENEHNEDPFLKRLIEGHLTAFRVRFEIAQLNIKVVAFLTDLVQKGFPAFKKTVNKHVGRTYRKAHKVGGQAVQVVGGKALAGARTAGDYLSSTGTNIYKEIMTKGWNLLVKWSGLEQADYDYLVAQTDDQYEVIEEDQGIYNVQAGQWKANAESQQQQHQQSQKDQ